MRRWRHIPGHTDYKVSDDGMVRCMIDRHHRNGAIMYKAPFDLTLTTSKAGYHVVGLWNRTQLRSKQYKVHRLVAMAFIGDQPRNKLFVAHRDGNPRNNIWHNLYYATPKDNSDDRARHGNTPSGISIHTAKLNNDIAHLIRDKAKTLKPYGRNIILAREHNVSTGTIKRVLSGQCWIS